MTGKEMDREDIDPEDLEVVDAMEASVEVCTHTCSCGRVSPIEYTPPPHLWYATGSTCACGREITYGE